MNVDGTPKVMYHGTRAENGDFYVFDSSKAVKKGGLGLRAMGKGNYFTAKKLDGTERYGSRVIPAYLDIKNPFVYNGGNDFRTQVTNALGLDPKIDDDALQQEMRNRGYDGVVQYDSNGEVSIAVTFDSNQIKSATDNIGTFDGSNPDIRYQRRTSTLTNRDILEQAAQMEDNPSINRAQRNALGIYSKKLGELRQLERQRSEKQAELAQKEKAGAAKRSLVGLKNQIKVLDQRIARESDKLLEYEKVDYSYSAGALGASGVSGALGGFFPGRFFARNTISTTMPAMTAR